MRPLTLIGIRRMRSLLRSMMLGPALAVVLSGCGDFLTGPKLQDDPNNPTAASNEALFVASQVNISAQLESRLTRLTALNGFDLCDFGAWERWGNAQVLLGFRKLGWQPERGARLAPPEVQREARVLEPARR